MARKRRSAAFAIAFGCVGLAMLVFDRISVSGFVRPAPLPLITSSPIMACGRIAKAGYYEVDNPLFANPEPGDCLQISAPNVSLNLNGQDVSSTSGNGVGVHVMPTGAHAFIEGRGATIAGFGEGVEIDGLNAFAEYFVTEKNSDAGVLLNRAHQAYVANFITNGNSFDGVRLASAAQSAIESFSASGNNRYGVWLLGASHNTVSGFSISDNTIAGVYLGCAFNGPKGTCEGPPLKSAFNAIFDGSATTSQNAPLEDYGVAIDLGNLSNRVINIVAQWNTTQDIYDANTAPCGRNLWFALDVIKTPALGGCSD